MDTMDLVDIVDLVSRSFSVASKARKTWHDAESPVPALLARHSLGEGGSKMSILST